MRRRILVVARALAALASVTMAGLALRIVTASAGQQGKEADTTVTPAMLALGDSIFHGRAAGGLCFTCHGPTAKGMPGLGPDLTDSKWLHGDGSLAFIIDVVTKGVPKPKQAAAPMLPMGGARLTPAQIRAVAAYVRSLSAKKP